MNKVVARDRNATVSGGNAVLSLPDTKNGAFIGTELIDGGLGTRAVSVYQWAAMWKAESISRALRTRSTTGPHSGALVQRGRLRENTTSPKF